MRKTVYKAIAIAYRDNVATAIDDIKIGEEVLIKRMGKDFKVTVKQSIPFGHKFAIKKIDREEEVIKYGEVIGIAASNIDIGEHVHVHNLVSSRKMGYKR